MDKLNYSEFIKETRQRLDAIEEMMQSSPENPFDQAGWVDIHSEFQSITSSLDLVDLSNISNLVSLMEEIIKAAIDHQLIVKRKVMQLFLDSILQLKKILESDNFDDVKASSAELAPLWEQFNKIRLKMDPLDETCFNRQKDIDDVPAIPLKDLSVLLIEDAPVTSRLEIAILEKEGCLVECCVDGPQALELVKTKDFDIIISDIQLPSMDGFNLIEEIKQHPAYMDKPVIVISNRESDEDLQRGKSLGVNAYLIKNQLTAKLLLDAVRTSLKQ